MSENIDINVGIIKEEISINAANNIVEVNISTAPVTIINPQNYDLSQFTNTSPNPFIQQSTLSSYVPISRIITINGVAQDLSTNRSWTIPGATWGSITGTLAAQTDLQAALNARVPYTGATSNVNLGEYGLTTGQLTLDTSPTGTAVVGTTRWNDSIGSSETTLKGGSVILKNGVDLVARVVNKVTPNATLTKANYTAVRISGAQGQRLAIAYAQANSDANSADTIGLVAETIPTNQEGFIITVGNLEGVNTTGSLQGESWSDGDVLYLSPTIPGAITNIKPTGLTGHIVVIGYVEYAHAINGKIYVKIMNGWELDELHNVYINPATLANNNILQYDSADQLWKNKVLSTGITIGTTAITSGVVGRVLFEGAGNVVQESSSLFWDDTNNRLGIGTSTPTTKINIVTPNNGDALRLEVPSTNSTVYDFYLGNSGTTSYIRANPVILEFRRQGTPSTIRTVGGVLNDLALQASGGITFTTYDTNERMRIIGSTGNVLIGTTTDAGFKLDVVGNSRISGNLRLLNTSDTLEFANTLVRIRRSSNRMNFEAFDGFDFTDTNISATRIRIFGTTGNIGINTTTDNNYKFDVNGTGNFEGNLRLGVGFQLLFNNNNVGLYRDANTLRLGGFGGIEFLASATNISAQSIRMKIFDTGNVGINTTTDNGFKLDVNGTAIVRGDLSTSAGKNMLFGTTLPSRQTNSAQYPAIFVGNSNSGIFGETTTGYKGINLNANVVRDTSLFWVLQDTTQPGWLVGVNYETGFTDAFSVNRAPATTGTANISTLFQVKGSGNVLINTTTDAGFRLDVNGTARVNGQLNLSTNVSATTSSAFGLNYITFNALTANQGIAAGFSPNGTPTGYAYSFQFAKSSTANVNSLLLIGGGSSAGPASNKHLITTSTDGTATAQPLAFAVATGSWASATALMTLTTTQNVLIGTTTDVGYKLDVNGTSRVTSTSTAHQFVATTNGSSFMVNSTNVLDYGDGLRLAYSGGSQKVTIFTNSGTPRFQVVNSGSILIGTTTELASSLLTLESTTRGFLPPRMTTTQKNAIATPATGLMVYDTDLNRPCFYNGSSWITL